MLAIDHEEPAAARWKRSDRWLDAASLAERRDAWTVAGLRRGDERTVAALVVEHRAAMLRLARCYVADRATAEDVVQETWIAVLRGVDRFDGRAALKTWIFRILVNRAKTIGMRQARLVPVGSLVAVDRQGTTTGNADFFDRRRECRSDERADGLSPPTRSTEDQVTCSEDVVLAIRAIAQLPAGQRRVITLRDVHSWPAEEVSAAMGVSEGNQRVLLHRARARVRRHLAELGAGEAARLVDRPAAGGAVS